jgi:hypothetical protein
LKIGEPLTGQDVMIKSVFNPKDKRPSMSIYVLNGREYKLNDHSTGKKGSKVDLVMTLTGLSYGETVEKLIDEYNLHLLNNDMPVQEFVARSRYGVADYNRRKWTVNDRDYWTAYGIGSKELELFGVYPISSYSLSNEKNTLTIEGKMIYGYFSQSGVMYKIYQPRALERRFMKVGNHLQGIDQLKFEANLLIITKSLKDVICCYNLWRPMSEAIAVDSENTMLKPAFVDDLKMRFSEIIVILDNDEPGINAMIRYQELHGLKYIISPLEKDISDSIKVHGIAKTKQVFDSLITDKILEDIIK